MFSLLIRLTSAIILNPLFVSSLGLEVTISANKSVFMLGEPVILSATLRNSSLNAEKVLYQNAPTLYRKTGLIDIQTSTDGKTYDSWRDFLRPAKMVAPKLLASGEEEAVDLVMFFSAESGLFAKQPGTYLVRGRVVGEQAGEVFSTSIAIEFVEPRPIADTAHWEWLKANQDEYGRMVQIPWDAKLSDEFLREAKRRCEIPQSVYSEYLGLFLSRAYREGPTKNPELSSRYAQIAKERATTDKIRSEADKLLRSPRVDPSAPASAPAAAGAVDAATQRAVTEVLNKFAAAITGGRLDECGALLSEDFLRNGFTDKARMISILEDDLVEHQGSVVSLVVDAISAGANSDEVEVSSRQVARIPGRETEERRVKWVLRREGSSWVIRRRDDTPNPGGPRPASPDLGP